MTKVAIISKDRGREIFGKVYADKMLFNPILDKNMNILISEQEINQLDREVFPWVDDEIELKEPSEIIKELTKEQWLEQDKLEYEKLLQEINAKLEEIKK